MSATETMTIETINVRVSELRSLLEVICDLAGDIRFDKPNARERANIERVQNLAEIADLVTNTIADQLGVLIAEGV